MDFIHIGLVCSSETNADRFFGQLLEMPMTRRSSLPAQLAAALFGVERDCEILYYGDGGLVFEVFVTGFSEPAGQRMDHTCIAVSDRARLIARCREMEFEVRTVEKGGGEVVFIVDADGNLFEIRTTA